MLAGVSDTVLAKCPLFRGMTAPERHELIAMLENKSYSPGETILAEGESRMKREQTAVKAISDATTGAPSGPVSL